MMRRPLVSLLVVTLLLTVVTPALAGSVETVRDEFTLKTYSGNDGTLNWTGDWVEVPVADGPVAGQIQVGNDGSCDNSNCLRFGPDTMTSQGVYREVNLNSYSQATLTFSYQRDLLGGGDGSMRVKTSSDGWTWTTLRTYSLDASDSDHIPVTVDLSNWAGDTAMVGFFGDGDFGAYFYVDNVQIAMSFNGTPSFDNSLSDRSDSEGDTVTVTPEASDPENDDLSFSAVGLPPGVSIDADTGVVSGTIAYTAASSSPYTTVVTASDGFGGVANESFAWVVADVSVTEGSVLEVTAIVADPDLPDDSHSFTLTSAPSGAAVSAAGVITWTPGETDGPDVFEFIVKVADSGTPTAWDTETFAATVTETNSMPTLEAISDQANGVGDAVYLATSASDPDLPTNTLRFSVSDLPPGLSINSSSGVISGPIPSTAPQSSHTVTVKVKDDGSPTLEATRSFSWQVTRGNHAPVLAAIADQEPASTGVVSFTATATDADPGDTLTYWSADGIDAIPAGATINETTGKFIWDPSDSQYGVTYRINIGVSDSGSPQLSDTQLVTIVLPRLNRPPTVTSPGDQSSSEGDQISLTIEAIDPDAPGDSLRFSAATLPPGLSINSVTGVIAGKVDYEAATQSPYTVTVTATDDGSPQKSDTESFKWTVDETNRPPTATASFVIALVGEPTLVLLNAEDPDGDELEYTISDSPVAGILEGEAPEMFYTSPGGVLEDAFTFIVTDGEFEAEAEVTLEIWTSNSPPSADADSYDVAADELLTVNAPGVLSNDSDLDADPLTAILISQPDHGRLVLNEDGSFTYLPDEGFAGGDKFIYAASDALGEQSTATVLVTIVGPAVVIVPPTEEGPRAGVVVASTALWQPVPSSDEAILAEVPRAVVTAFNSGISSLPELKFPLLLLAIALLLGLTFGRISVLPFGATRRHEEGWVQAYDEVHQVGTVIPDGGASEVFVHGRSLEHMASLTPGQRVRFVAAETRGRRLALRVWPATSP